MSAAKSSPPDRPAPGARPGGRKSMRPVLGPALRMALRLAFIGAVAYGAHQLIDAAMVLSDRLPQADADRMQTALLLTALLVYAALIATPFVPGIEIGLALLLMRGAAIAPAVYVATVLGLMLAYAVGRLLPEASIVRLLSDLRLRRAAALVADYAGLSPTHRQEKLEAGLPRWVSLPLIRYRYLTLAALLNLPGNVVFGGGGGLLMMAGLSRLYRPRQTCLTLMVAVLPVPLVVWWIGPGLLS